ncbi:Uncharacterized protein Adt_20060 [Abeliophyllum distichum]|uniref:Uncharacterized protein n=1 Tax=Abeliophyllum distichum TaxID=126358 RepID=A0ABD1SUP2_9LAMI
MNPMWAAAAEKDNQKKNKGIRCGLRLSPTEEGVATIRGNQYKARKCYRNALRKAKKKEVNMTIRDVEMEEASEETSEDVEMEEALSLEDIDPRITRTDSQTSSVEELEKLSGRSP